MSLSEELPDFRRVLWKLNIVLAISPASLNVSFDLCKLTVKLELGDGEDLDGAGVEA